MCDVLHQAPRVKEAAGLRCHDGSSPSLPPGHMETNFNNKQPSDSEEEDSLESDRLVGENDCTSCVCSNTQLATEEETKQPTQPSCVCDSQSHF